MLGHGSRQKGEMRINMYLKKIVSDFFFRQLYHKVDHIVISDFALLIGVGVLVAMLGVHYM